MNKINISLNTCHIIPITVLVKLEVGNEIHYNFCTIIVDIMCLSGL